MYPNFAGALVNGALYLVGVFVAGLVTAHPTASKLALAALGVTYIAHVIQFTAFQTSSEEMRDTGNMVAWASVALGVAAGVLLLF
jgi:hypothetical protein